MKTVRWNRFVFSIAAALAILIAQWALSAVLVADSAAGVSAGSDAALVSPPIHKFDHIIVIVQENRTPDNLFQGLCKPPFGSSSRCSENPSPTQYDIQTSNWLNYVPPPPHIKPPPPGPYPVARFVPPRTIQPTPVPLKNNYDLDHSHSAFVAMCDWYTPLPEGGVGHCLMDGARNVGCSPQKGKSCPPNPQFKFVDNSTGILNPYLELATLYGWANYMFQTNQGPSFPAHQFLFGGTSAPNAGDDAKGIFASENVGLAGIGTAGFAGCIADAKTRVPLIDPPGVENRKMYPCFEHKTMGDLLRDQTITWRYYTPSAGSIWTAPTAIRHICEPGANPLQCLGQEWKDHVDIPDSTTKPPKLGPPDVLTDISNGSLRAVSWVIPSCDYSDHAKCSGTITNEPPNGPSWVASIVNAIGNSMYWDNTAIFITWDDWGGWYDHVPPTILPQPQGDYQYGFRVPLIVVSAYTPRGDINNVSHDFGSILRFIENNFGISEGALNFADARATTDLSGFFNLGSPRQFQNIKAPKNAAFFLNSKRPATGPDDDE